MTERELLAAYRGARGGLSRDARRRRPVYPPPASTGAPRGARRPSSRRRRRTRRGDRGARAAAEPGLSRADRAVLRLRGRGVASRRAGRRLARLDVGPERSASLALDARRRSSMENIAGAWVDGAPRAPARRSFAFVTGCQMAHVDRLAAARQHVLDARRLGSARARSRRCAADPVRRRRASATRRSTEHFGCLGIGRAQVSRSADERDGRMDAARSSAALAESDGPTIVCAQAGEVNTGVVRRLRRDRRRRRGVGRMAPRRRRLRALGGGEPVASASRRGTRARGLLGDGRAQVAERPVRLRDRALRHPAPHRAR